MKVHPRSVYGPEASMKSRKHLMCLQWLFSSENNQILKATRPRQTFLLHLIWANKGMCKWTPQKCVEELIRKYSEKWPKELRFVFISFWTFCTALDENALLKTNWAESGRKLDEKITPEMSQPIERNSSTHMNSLEMTIFSCKLIVRAH